jgi:predicted O-methyltransferase YrrM
MNHVENLIVNKYGLSGGSPMQIKGMGREKLYQLFNELGYCYGAEIGVRDGENASTMFHTIPNLHLFLVDPWFYIETSRITKTYHDRALRRMKNRAATIYHMTGDAAAQKVADNSLDFVFIDGDHSYDGCMLDIILWSRKVKSGGIVSGHDYIYKRQGEGVKRAVDNYVVNHKINPWFLTDNTLLIKGDTTGSWFWVKQ